MEFRNHGKRNETKERRNESANEVTEGKARNEEREAFRRERRYEDVEKEN